MTSNLKKNCALALMIFYGNTISTCHSTDAPPTIEIIDQNPTYFNPILSRDNLIDNHEEIYKKGKEIIENPNNFSDADKRKFYLEILKNYIQMKAYLQTQFYKHVPEFIPHFPYISYPDWNNETQEFDIGNMRFYLSVSINDMEPQIKNTSLATLSTQALDTFLPYILNLSTKKALLLTLPESIYAQPNAKINEPVLNNEETEESDRINVIFNFFSALTTHLFLMQDLNSQLEIYKNDNNIIYFGQPTELKINTFKINYKLSSPLKTLFEKNNLKLITKDEIDAFAVFSSIYISNNNNIDIQNREKLITIIKQVKPSFRNIKTSCIINNTKLYLSKNDYTQRASHFLSSLLSTPKIEIPKKKYRAIQVKGRGTYTPGKKKNHSQTNLHTTPIINEKCDTPETLKIMKALIEEEQKEKEKEKAKKLAVKPPKKKKVKTTQNTLTQSSKSKTPTKEESKKSSNTEDQYFIYLDGKRIPRPGNVPVAIRKAPTQTVTNTVTATKEKETIRTNQTQNRPSFPVSNKRAKKPEIKIITNMGKQDSRVSPKNSIQILQDTKINEELMTSPNIDISSPISTQQEEIQQKTQKRAMTLDPSAEPFIPNNYREISHSYLPQQPINFWFYYNDSWFWCDETGKYHNTYLCIDPQEITLPFSPADIQEVTAYFQ